MVELRKKVRLLVVDSEKEYYARLIECLELFEHQYDVETRLASDSSDAALIMQSWEPSLVLLDLHTSPAKQGALVERCKAFSIPIVATAETITPQLEENALSRGAVAYLVKSIDPDEIENFVHSLVQLSGQHPILH